ncbi:hypothetical protein [Streptomyces rugosispiralis]|uniref:Glyoxalase n=1 Tax=Streptomyces rugosispiralis TaxID=2967341 RepID=A0ABT1UNP8_9ACTN|nr:hypothetical protein [Streptomyces rugosispiralis]MCQ8186767.1 hypothetical protein [Streptomyces rugosispiralis]
MSHRPAMRLAIPVNDLTAARHFHGRMLGLSEGRSTDHRNALELTSFRDGSMVFAR